MLTERNERVYHGLKGRSSRRAGEPTGRRMVVEWLGNNGYELQAKMKAHQRPPVNYLRLGTQALKQ